MCDINDIFAYGESAPPVDEAESLRVRHVGLGHRRLSRKLRQHIPSQAERIHVRAQEAI